jgi:hypothetical protein
MGLSHHLELGVASAARDRLLEQMQRGHGDEDYCAVARKYFTGTSSEAKPESGLDLFEPRKEPEPEVWIHTQPPEAAPAAPEMPEQKEDVDLAPVAAESAPVEEPPAEPVAEAPASAPVEEEVAAVSAEPIADSVDEEPEERRGFLGRLLRRESNS